jgi:imidazolonepropionase-like amidohydrolase
MVKMEGAQDLMLELYYDTTVDPFAEPEFNAKKVEQLLKILKARGIKIRIVDTAGWDREMLYEVFRRACRTSKSSGEIFGPRKRRGCFFGREVPALLLIRDGRIVNVYPQKRDGKTETIVDCLQTLLKWLEVKVRK